MDEGARVDNSPGLEEQAANGRLTSSDLIRIDYLPVPEPLTPFVTALYHFTCDEPQLADVIPAGIGYVMAVLSGSASLTFADGRSAGALPLSLLTPTSGAASVLAEGPLHLVGAALSPLGWGALTDLPAFEIRDQVLPAERLLGESAATERLKAWQCGYASGTLSGEFVAAELCGLLGTNFSPLPRKHLALIRETGAWLSSSFAPTISDLGIASGYSARQVERLVKRYFGSTPRELVRKYRALRVAALLQAPDCTDEAASQLIDLFYDQSHLIREMRHYLGRTPTRLAGEESALTQAINGIENYREREPSFARIPKG